MHPYFPILTKDVIFFRKIYFLFLFLIKLLPLIKSLVYLY